MKVNFALRQTRILLERHAASQMEHVENCLITEGLRMKHNGLEKMLLITK